MAEPASLEDFLQSCMRQAQEKKTARRARFQGFFEKALFWGLGVIGTIAVGYASVSVGLRIYDKKESIIAYVDRQLGGTDQSSLDDFILNANGKVEGGKNAKDGALDLIAPVPDNLRDIRRYAKQGLSLMEEDRLNEARAAFEKGNALGKDHVLLASYASLELTAGNLGESHRLVEEAIALKPDFPTAYLIRARLLDLQDNIEEALRDYRQCLHLKPDYPNVNFEAARLLLQKGDLKEAIVFLEQEVKNNPRDIVKRTLAATYQKTGLENEAIAVWTDLARSNPKDPDIFQSLGESYRDIGRLEDAISSFSRALELRPENPGSLDGIASAYASLAATSMRSRDYRASIEHAIRGLAYRRTSDLNNIIDDSVINMIRDASREKTEWQAIDYLTEKLPNKRRDISKAFLEIARDDNEERHYWHAVMADSTFVLPKIQLAKLILDSDTKGALEVLADAKRLEPNNPSIDLHLGLAYMRTGEKPLMFHHLKRAVDNDPWSEDAYIWLCSVYITEDRLDDALSLLRGLSATVPPTQAGQLDAILSKYTKEKEDRDNRRLAQDALEKHANNLMRYDDVASIKDLDQALQNLNNGLKSLHDSARELQSHGVDKTKIDEHIKDYTATISAIDERKKIRSVMPDIRKAIRDRCEPESAQASLDACGSLYEIIDENSEYIRSKGFSVEEAMMIQELNELKAGHDRLFTTVERWRSHALQLLRRSSYAEAEKLYSKVIRIAPLDYVSWNNMGVIELRTGRLIEARKSFAEAVRLGPECEDCRNNYQAVSDELERNRSIVIDLDMAKPSGLSGFYYGDEPEHAVPPVQNPPRQQQSGQYNRRAQIPRAPQAETEPYACDSQSLDRLFLSRTDMEFYTCLKQPVKPGDKPKLIEKRNPYNTR